MDHHEELVSRFRGSRGHIDGITTRMIERKIEDESFTPVIVKREDSFCVHPGDVLERSIKDGLRLHQRNKISLFLSAISAGFFLGFSILCVSIIIQLDLEILNSNFEILLMALFYPLGFILCIMSGLVLFTEQTALAFYPFLAKKINFLKLFSLWAVTILGNLFGAGMIALLLKVCEPVIKIEFDIIDLSWKMISYSNVDIFFSSVLAGVLMAHGSWLIKTTSSTSGQVFYIYLVTFIIGLAGFHHSIAGSVKLFYLALSHYELLSILMAVKFLVVALSGNLVGGVFFIAIFNYWQIRHSQKIKSHDSSTNLSLGSQVQI